MEIKVTGINEALTETANVLLEKGVPRKTRGFDCVELPEVTTITITNPRNRYITNRERKWNKYLGAAESLWLMSGVNAMDQVGMVVENLYNFSDDGKFMRAGYGPRIRGFSGVAKDYEYHLRPDKNPEVGIKQLEVINIVDQLKYCVLVLKKDISSRQASITIHDPAKDCFCVDGKLKVTKDQPCTRLIQFMERNGKLDCTVYMRSNDFLWGMSAVNIFNFTILQEVVSALVGIPMGEYHHVVNNLHFYDNFRDKITEIQDSGCYAKFEDFKYSFPKNWKYSDFEKQIDAAYMEFRLMCDSGNPYYTPTPTGIDLFDDLLKTLAIKFGHFNENDSFKNNNLKNLFNYGKK